MHQVTAFRSKMLMLCAALVLSAGTGMAQPLASTATTYQIHVITPLTGSASFLGNGVAENYRALETVLNKQSGADRLPVHFVFDDDQTNPQTAVQVATQLIAENPAVILGSAVVSMCNAVAPLVSHGPVMYCISPSFMPVKGGYGFSAGTATLYQIGAIIRYMRLKGWTRIGVLNSIDATGQNADKDLPRILDLPENGEVKIVVHEHFNPKDVSVTAQLEHIKAAGSQALISWTTGSPVATVFKGMIQTGLDIPVGTSSGNQIAAQLDQYAGFMPKLVLIGSALFPPHEGILKLDPRVEDAQHQMYAALDERNRKPDISTAVTWDAGLIVAAGLRRLGPDASATQLRDYIASLTDFAGVDGIYDFNAYYDHGLGPDSAAVVTYDPPTKNWKWLSKPGGEPLP